MWPVTYGAAQKNIKLYRIYRAMVSRCYSPKNEMYASYGGRGIRVDADWLDDPLKFVNWALKGGYAQGLSIDRIDNNGIYGPENCKWSTSKEQARNTQKTRMIEFHGETRCMADWAEITGIPAPNIQVRIDRCGWSVERALTEAPKKRNQLVTYNGDSMTVNDWAKKAGVNHSTILARIKSGSDLSAPPTPRTERKKSGAMQ